MGMPLAQRSPGDSAVVMKTRHRGEGSFAARSPDLMDDDIIRLVDRLLSAHPGRVYREALVAVERPLLVQALASTGGNQLRAARLLGLNRNTLRKRCRELGLPLPGVPGRAH
jgi:DNA-binding protein Fis